MGLTGARGTVQVQQAFGIGCISDSQRKTESGGVSFTRHEAVKAEARINGKIEELLHG